MATLHDPGGSSNAGPPSPCAGRLSALFVTGDFSGGGLLHGCRRTDIERVFGASGTPGHGTLSNVYRAWTSYRVPGQRWPVRVWWDSVDPDAVLLIDVDEPHSTTATGDLLAKLGPAEQELASHDLGARAELVYASRGMTLAVGSLAEAASHDEPLRRVRVYAPTTIEDYVTRLGGQDPFSTPLPGTP